MLNQYKLRCVTATKYPTSKFYIILILQFSDATPIFSVLKDNLYFVLLAVVQGALLLTFALELQKQNS